MTGGDIWLASHGLLQRRATIWLRLARSLLVCSRLSLLNIGRDRRDSRIRMQTAAASEARDDFVVLTSASPSRAQTLLALGVVPAILAVVFCISRPFAGVQLRPIEAFVPIYVTAMFLNGLITAVILFAQFSIVRTRALLVIANGYLFLSLMAI